jgi:hypothetical protein
VRVTGLDRQNFARFGCTLLPKQGLICINWDKDRQKQVSFANIIVRGLHGRLSSGPVFCLAFEISITKMLPQYCFFPFDLKNKDHRNYLLHSFKKQKLELCFLADSRQIRRTHELSVKGSAKIAGVFELACSDFKRLPRGKYDHWAGVAEFEQRVWLPEVFDRVLSESEFHQMIDNFRLQAAKVPPEQRARATKIANDLLEAFRSRAEGFISDQIKQFTTYRRALLFCSDLNREFEDDYPRFSQFISDVFTVHAASQPLGEIENLIAILKSVFNLADLLKTTPREEEESRNQLSAQFREIMDRAAGGRGLSINSIKGFLSIIGIPIGGSPGRNPEDYSAEYELRAAGFTWRQIAQHKLENNIETREEFGGRAYQDLSFKEQETLKHRIREGVRSHAKRTGNVLPAQKTGRSLPQKTS